MARVTSHTPIRSIKVFIVELKTEIPDTPNILTFGSKKAIFEYFGNDALRISYNYASTIDFTQGFENAMCSIIETHLLTLNSPEIAERREREGREVIPTRNAKGVSVMIANKKAQES